MSLKVIASLAGTSISTVSKAFSDSDEISKETKKRILEIAKQQGFFYKYNKQKYDKKLIAVISPEIKSDFFTDFLNTLNEEIKNQGGIMTASISEFSAGKIEELFAYYSFYCNVDGIIILDNNIALDNNRAIPAVSITPFEEAKSSNVDMVKWDMTEAIERVIRYFKENGHQKIGFASERLTSMCLESFKSAMKKEGMEIKQEYIKISSKRFEEAGIDMMEEWIASDDRPTAIIAAYDYIAIGIMNALRKHGYRVPEDCSVVGMNDIGVSSYLATPLSTIRINREEACKVAVELLMRRIEEGMQNGEQSVVVSSNFVIRNSSGMAPSSK